MTPTKDPLTELAGQLAAIGGPDVLAVRDGLARHPGQAHLAIRSVVLAAAAAHRDEEPLTSDEGIARLVLIIDQFEQVFTLNPDLGGDATRQAFITALCSAAQNPAGPGHVPPALVVISVRGDFWDRCATVPELVGALQDGQFVVGPMTESELRMAITGPAEAARLRIDPALTDTILGDLRVAGADSSSGVLPLLSQAMALTWEHREDDRLTSRGYAQAGGVSHAVQTGADRAYDALPARHQAIARDVLRSMTVASRDGGLARRPVTRDDLYAALPGATRSDIDAVLDAFAAERLAVLDEDTAQLSHDVLLRAWPRLRGWLEEDQASWILHGQLDDAAAAWHDSKEDPSFLYRGAQLATLQQAVTRWSADPARYPALTGTQRDFLQASERAATRSSRRRRSSFAVLALLTALAVAAAGFAFSQRAAAVQQRNQAIYNQVVAEALQSGASDTTLAAQLTLAAYRLQPTQDLASRLLNTENTPLSRPLTGSGASVYSMTFSPGTRTLATGNDDGTIRLWDVADPAHPTLLSRSPTGSGVTVDSVAFSPGGRTLASGSGDGTVRLWDVADPARPRPLSQPRMGSAVSVGSVAFSPGGRTLASGSGDGTVRLWDVADPAHPTLLSRSPTGRGDVYSVAFSAGGRMLASGHFDGTVRLWDVADPAHPRPLGQLPAGGSSVASIYSVAFSPGGRTLASGSGDGTVRLWDVADPAHPTLLSQPLTGGSAAATVDSVAFSPGGRTLADGSADGTVRLWDVADPAHPTLLSQPLTGGGGSVVSVAFSADGNTLVSGSGDGTIRLWNLPQTVLTGSTYTLGSVAFSADGHTLASNADGTIQLWDVTDPAHPRPLGRPLTGRTAGIGSVAFSPSVVFSPRGHTLAGNGSNRGPVRLWDVTDPARPRPLGGPLTGSAASVGSVAFSPGGRTLASGSDDSAIRLWDVTDPARPRPLGGPLTGSGGPVYAVAFSPGGRTLASGDINGVRLWDVTDPARPRPLSQPRMGSAASVGSVAFSPSGRTLASGSGDGTVRLWDVTDPAHPHPLSQPLTRTATLVFSVAFSPSGRTLASGDFHGVVRLWDVADPASPRPLGQPLTGSAASVYSVAFSPGGNMLASGSIDGTTRLWNLNVQYAIQRICATAGGLTPQQWNQYIPELRYQPSCVH